MYFHVIITWYSFFAAVVLCFINIVNCTLHYHKHLLGLALINAYVFFLALVFILIYGFNHSLFFSCFSTKQQLIFISLQPFFSLFFDASSYRHDVTLLLFFLMLMVLLCHSFMFFFHWNFRLMIHQLPDHLQLKFHRKCTSFNANSDECINFPARIFPIFSLFSARREKNQHECFSSKD